MAAPAPDPALLLNLLAGCRRLERASQRQFYRQFFAYGLSICRRYLHDPDVAQEAVNDGFVKVFQELPHFDPNRFPHDLVSSLRGWLRRIMVRTAIDHFRTNHRHHLQTDLEAAGHYPADNGPTPLDALSFEELLRLIAQLPPAYRTVFNLFAIDGYSHEEIAESLGISTGASKSNLFKARAHLKTLLKHHHHHAYAGYVR